MTPIGRSASLGGGSPAAAHWSPQAAVAAVSTAGAAGITTDPGGGPASAPPGRLSEAGGRHRCGTRPIPATRVRHRTGRGRSPARAGNAARMSVSHQTVTLARGKQASPAGGACVMELASMLAGEPFTDRPASVCPVIAAFLRSYNDAVDDRRRQDLYRYAAAGVGTRAPAAVMRRRAQRCLHELRALRRWPLGTLTAPRALPESVPAMERLAARLAREIHASGIGSHG